MSSRQKKSVELTPQKFTWKTIATYDRYEDADASRCGRKVGGGKRLKVKRRGVGRFEVRMGTPLSREMQDNA